MELRFKLFWIVTLCQMSILSPCLAADLNAIYGDDFTMSCFKDPNVDSYHVRLLYTSPGADEVIIGKYEPASGTLAEVHVQFASRLSFSPLYNVTIKNIQLTDEGVYKCTVLGFSIPGEPTISHSLTVYVEPTVEASLMGSLTAGSDLKNAASCSAIDGKPEPIVKWTTDRHLVFNQTQTSTPSTTPDLWSSHSTLYVSPTKFYNNQEFSCEISHPTFPDGKIVTVVLNVTYPPSIPNIVVIDEHTKLECSSDGNPTPTIKWQMPGLNPSPDSNIVRLISPKDPARQNDTYTCTAFNNIETSATASITTGEAVAYVEFVKTSNTGVIVGAVVGGIVLILIIAVLVYWFVIRKHREKDDGPYNPAKNSRPSDDESGWNRSSGRRPMIQHANESLNKNAPPSPTHPPPQDDEEEGSDNNSQSDVEEFTEGHDVDLNSPLTGGEYDDDMPTSGIVSKNSVNFQPYWRNSVAEHRRHRPSTSPHRRSQHRDHPEPSPRVIQPSDPHYEVPPKEHYDDDYDHEEDDRLMREPYHPEDDGMDQRFYDLPQDRYPGYQPRYDDPPHHEENLPPYTDTVQYAAIDHDYNSGKPRTRPPYHEPVEYAEIRSKGQIV